MSKIAIIYWSQTGNTETMANAVKDGIISAGAEADIFSVSDISADKAAEYEKLALGCPSMGDEVLEESEFEPFFSDLEPKIKGKKIALFGSYGWGDGQWMRDWTERAKNAGAEIANAQGLTVNETPDDEGIANCNELGKALVAM